MKKLLVITVLSVCFSLNAQKQKETIKVNTSKSSIEWEGTKAFKIDKHYGIVHLKSGTVKTKALKLVGGHFIVDMNTIANTDGKYSKMLVDHLKDDDFFSVAKYPEAKLSINKVFYKDATNVEIFADLTIKGITNPIRFNAAISNKKSEFKLESQFKINRTLWGINYKSQGLFGTVKDGIISDAISFKVLIVWFEDLC